MRLQLLLFLLSSLVLGAQESTASKQVSTFLAAAPQLGAPKKIWVWLPGNYDSSRKDYPVLYLHDAQNVFDGKTSFAGEWEADETLEKLDAQIIVVAIEHGGEKRIDELTPYPHAKYGGGKADAYLEFIAKTLKPEIDRRYRTKAQPQDTAIMGSSLGGLLSFYAVLRYGAVFGKAGVFSPSFWFSPEIYDLAGKADLEGKRLYFLCGDKEDDNMVSDMYKMISRITAKGAETTERVIGAGEHNEKLWRENFGGAVEWLFAR